MIRTLLPKTKTAQWSIKSQKRKKRRVKGKGGVGLGVLRKEEEMIETGGMIETEGTGKVAGIVQRDEIEKETEKGREIGKGREREQERERGRIETGIGIEEVTEGETGRLVGAGVLKDEE